MEICLYTYDIPQYKSLVVIGYTKLRSSCYIILVTADFVVVNITIFSGNMREVSTICHKHAYSSTVKILYMGFGNKEIVIATW